MSKEYNRFDFEQQIMQTWHVVDDLRSLADNAKGMSKKDIVKALEGMAVLYDLKFNTVFDSFEKSVPHSDAGQGLVIETDD